MQPPKYDTPYDNGRLNYVASIPQELQHAICKCGHTKGYTHLHERGDYWVCGECRKPTNLWAYTEECYGCGVFYVVETKPDEELLCNSCKDANAILHMIME